jgi:hypothetical protein
VLRSRSAHDHWQRRGFVQAEAVRSTANISVPAAGPHARACGTMPGQMRLAVFSEVHGRVERLSACLHSIARVGADELWCLGDTVDAFAVRQPELIVACVNAIDDVCAVKLTGNHEAWALQDGSLPDAAGTVLAAWTVAAYREGVLAVQTRFGRVRRSPTSHTWTCWPSAFMSSTRTRAAAAEPSTPKGCHIRHARRGCARAD